MKRYLRWWLFVCFTFFIQAVALWLGFGQLLIQSDITYLGVTVMGAYALATGWLGWKIYHEDYNYDPLWYVSEIMEKVGLLGTFIGLAVAFQHVATLDTESPLFKAAIMTGVLTKLYCSIVGLIGAMFLRTQIKILEH